LHKKNIYTIEDRVNFKRYSETLSSSLVKTFSREIFDLEVNAKDQQLIIAGVSSEVYDLKQSQFTPLNRIMNSRNSRCNCDGINIESDGRTFAWGRSSLHTYDNYNQIPANEYPINMNRAVRFTDVLVIDSTNTIISSTNGLYEYNKSEFSKIFIDSINPDLRINKLIKDGNALILATTGMGLVWWQNNKILFQLDKSDGLPSNIIESIHKYTKDRLLVSTKNGLSIVDATNKPNIITNIDSRRGLPSEEITSLATKGDSIFIGTAQGLVLLKSFEDSAKTAIPIVEQIVINNEISLLPKDTTFNYNDNNITIDYKLLDYKQLGDINYAYRLNNNNWSNTKNTSVSYASLKPDKYNFEIKAQNIIGAWGPSVNYNFSINPPWWRTSWFNFLALVIGGLSIYLIYRARIKAINDKVIKEEELRRLEMSALKAQMNPHFIFNCLNSIQRYIMANDPKTAMSYMSHFAKLIRQTLEASSRQSIPLRQEIDMISNYLKLEQLRQKNKFQYTIESDDTIDLLQTKMPPLLIQPFIENAVIHGMKAFSDRGGMISISYMKPTDHVLLIKVNDNGQWIEPSQDSSEHNSMGMAITAKRLELLNLQSRDNIHVTKRKENGGTTVEIQVRLDQSTQVINHIWE